MTGEPAFPNKDHLGDGPEGLTKRELFAAMAMQALMTSDESIKAMGEVAKDRSMPSEEVTARLAVSQADALIEALTRTANV